MHGPITVADLLKRRIFQNGYVAAGEAGLTRRVSWVHILDLPEARSLIRGGELILSTGIGFAQRPNGFYHYVQQLIEEGAAGLCIELGTAVTRIPEAVTELANECAFPIILFPEQVHFVDITQDIHRLIVSRHHKLIDDLEDLSRKLQRLTVTAMGSQQMLQLIHDVTKCTVLYQRIGNKPLIVGNPPGTGGDLSAEWSAHFPATNEPVIEPTIVEIPEACTRMRELGDVAILRSATVLGMNRGTFVLLSHRATVDDYVLLVVDRVSNALSLDEFRRLSVEERQLFSEQDWVEQLAHPGAGTNPLILNSSGSPKKRYCVAVISSPQPTTILTDSVSAPPNEPEDNDWLNRKANISMITRLAFIKYGIRPYLSVRPDIITAVLEWDAGPSPLKDRVHAVVQELKLAFGQSKFHPEIQVGVGHEVRVADVDKSYQTAMSAHTVLRKHPEKEILFYSEAGIYQWIQWLNMDEPARLLVTAEIRKVLHYDETHNSDLFRTLKTYLDCDRSIQKTAEQLFIHRQTLYHRLKQIEQLLDVNLEDPVQRLGLYVSIYYHIYATSD